MIEGLDDTRLLAAYCDLGEAREMITAYLLFADDPSCSEAWGQLPEGLADHIEHALLIAGIVAYTRPFVQSRGGGRSRLPRKLLSCLSREEHRIHSYLIEARNKILAHSDADQIILSVTRVGPTPLRSMAPTPVVVIPGEEDSMDIKKSTDRMRNHRDGAIEEITSIIQSIEDGSRPSGVWLVSYRSIDISADYCKVIMSMAEKIMEAIEEEARRIDQERSQ
jgi:hypothetical protein